MIGTAAAGLALFAAAGVAAGAPEPSVSEEAQTLIDLTRETQATYTLVTWNRITHPDGRVTDEWSAEFHDGVHHRVESPRDRMIADCAAMTGTYVRMGSAKMIEGASVARAACGVQANSVILSARIAGKRETRFGPATHLIVVDADYIRTYDVAANGALLGATISGRNGSRRLVNRAVSFTADVPPDIFSVESLGKSAVPERLRKFVRHPAPPIDPAR